MAIAVPVRPVTVGPIVGHTTDTTVRLWGRGAPPPSLGSQRCYGVAQLLEAGSTTPAQGHYFKLLPEDDYTGSVDFGGFATANEAQQERLRLEEAYQAWANRP